jgi:hypothetical protein
MTSPTQRALAYCRRYDWTAQVVEKWNPHARIRQDLFGCIDLVVLDGEAGGVLGVQVTSGSAHAARVKKSLEEPRLRTWLEAPARFEVWSFAKRGAAGKRKLWTLRAQALVLNDQAIQVVDIEKRPTR